MGGQDLLLSGAGQNPQRLVQKVGIGGSSLNLFTLAQEGTAAASQLGADT